MGYKYIPEHKAEARFNEMLNECFPLVEIGELKYEPANVLKSTDPIAYRCYFIDWLDSERLVIDECDATESEEEEDGE